LADNVELPSGSGGAIIATDDDGTAQHQYVKLEFGGDGTFTKVTSAAGLPVLAAANSGVDIGDVTVNNAAGASSVPIQGAAAADASVAGNPILAGARASSAAPTDMSGDGDAVPLWATLKGALNVADGGGSLTIDGTVDLGATDNAVLDAIAASVASIDTDATTIIGHVDGIEGLLTTIDGDTGSILTAVQLIDDAIFAEDVAATAADKGMAILAVRRDADTSLVGADNDYANLQVDANGRLKVEAFSGETLPISGTVTIQDGGNTITVDGTVAVTNAGLTELAAAINASSQMDVNIAASAATLTVASHAVTNAGTFATQVDGAALTALQLIDNLVLAEDAAHASGDPGVMPLAVRRDADTTLSATDGDYVPLQVNSTGALKVTGGGGGTQYAVDDVAGATDTGTLLLAVRDDSLATLTPADGDYAQLRVSSTGALHVTGGGGGTEYTVDAVAPAAPTGATFVMERDDALSALTEVEGDWTNPRANANGALWVKQDGTVTVDGSGVTQPVSHAALTELAAAINASSQMDVNIAASNATITVASHAVTNAGTFATQVDGNALTALQLIDNTIVVDDAAFTPGTTSVNMAGFQADETATDSVNEGDAGAARMTLDRKVIVNPQPHTTGGLTIFRSIDIDESEEEVKATAGMLYSIAAFNRTAAPLYLKFYNLTAANTTVGTSTPVLTFVVPANADSDGAGFIIEKTYGWTFDTAISVAATTGIADNDTGAPGANDCVINLGYL
jgi:hypothetical protein